jgi:mono/diheme cytochrome c family protein
MPRSLLFALAAAGLLLLMQWVPLVKHPGNPPVSYQVVWDTPQTEQLFRDACADCHSHETVWPWYSQVAPVSWFIQNHIREGREHFNVSVPPDQQGDSDEAAEELLNGTMPLRSYTALHPSARLSEQEKAQLAAGLEASLGIGYRGQEH